MGGGVVILVNPIQLMKTLPPELNVVKVVGNGGLSSQAVKCKIMYVAQLSWYVNDVTISIFGSIWIVVSPNYE